MNFSKGTISVTEMQITGDVDREVIAEALKENAFTSEGRENEELNIGFADFFDFTSSDFSNFELFNIDSLIVFGVRIDRIKVPSAVSTIRVNEACADWLAKYPHLKFIPKVEREQIRDRIRSQLLQKYDPVPSMVQVIINMDNGNVWIASRSRNVIDSVVGLFNQAVPQNRIIAKAPLKRYSESFSVEIAAAAKKLNEAATDSVLEWVEANSYVWNDFFAWMLFRTFNTDSQYSTATGQITAFLDDKFVLSGSNSEGKQRIVVTGSQVNANELRSALSQGLALESVKLCMKVDSGDSEISVMLDDQWLPLQSAKIPHIKPESDPDDDPIAERVASLLVRTDDIAKVRGLIDELVYKFLLVRSGTTSWYLFTQEYNEWLKGE